MDNAVLALCGFVVREGWEQREDEGDYPRRLAQKALAEADSMRAEIARLKAEVERVTEVARLLVGECEEQRECPVCGTDTNVEVCRPSCYVAKMRKLLDDDKEGGG